MTTATHQPLGVHPGSAFVRIPTASTTVGSGHGARVFPGEEQQNMALRWLSNAHDPSAKDADLYVMRRLDQTQDDAVREHRAWLRGKVIGAPKPTEAYTEDQLCGMRMVGVYVEESD